MDSLSLAMKIALEKENMTKQRHKVGVRRREGGRRGEGCIFGGGGVSPSVEHYL